MTMETIKKMIKEAPRSFKMVGTPPSPVGVQQENTRADFLCVGGCCLCVLPAFIA